MIIGLILIILLIVLSIYGAFIGDSRAKELFNSIPLTLYWLAFTLLLLIAILSFPRLLRFPPLLLMHIGCILILAGGLIGSEKGHQLQKRFNRAVDNGYMDKATEYNRRISKIVEKLKNIQ